MATETRDMAGWTSSWYANETSIQWEVKGNPKRSHGKSYARFENYFGCETVGAYLEKGGTKGDLKYDWQHGFLSLGDGEPVKIASELVESTPRVLEPPKHSNRPPKKANPVVTDVSEDDILG